MAKIKTKNFGIIEIAENQKIFFPNGILGFENEKEYGKGLDKFKLFEVDYGEEASSAFERANLERLELGSVGFLMLKDSIETKFDVMEVKYHNIHKDLEMLTYTIMVFAEHFAPEDEKIKRNIENLRKRIGV